jgi:hypothetical protein
MDHLQGSMHSQNGYLTRDWQDGTKTAIMQPSCKCVTNVVEHFNSILSWRNNGRTEMSKPVKRNLNPQNKEAVNISVFKNTNIHHLGNLR